METKFKSFHAKRLLKLAAFLDKVKPEKFSITSFTNTDGEYNKTPIVLKLANPSCGTTACAVGYMPIVSPRDWKFNEFNKPVLRRKDMLAYVDECVTIEKPRKHSAWYFGLTFNEWASMFLAAGYGDNPDVKPKAVSKKIRQFVAQKSAIAKP